MSSKSLTRFSTAILLCLLLTPSPVRSVDLDELYNNPDVPQATTGGDGKADAVDAGEDAADAISDLLDESDSVSVPKDVVVVLDNSGSMKKNDPDFLATRAVSEFISGLDAQTRIAVIIFDQQVTLAVPLTPLSLAARDSVLKSLKKINYRGLFTDSPAAIERAIYELKNNGRKDARKFIVFMTDGIVDTGKADVDLEKSKWLQGDLAAEAADESIRIFGIAFTEEADFQLIQSIAQKTDGEYYRALQAADLHRVFGQINDIINAPPEPVAEAQPEAPAEPVQVVQPAPAVQQPVIIQVPAQQAQTMSKEARVRSTIMIAAAAILFITLLAIVYLMLRRGRDTATGASEVVTDAYINDINNYTGSSQHHLGQKPTMFGRVAGKDTEHLDYLVIPQSTIGRRHALIEYKDYGFWISDQGSINGTFVNDQLISNEVCLKHGDRIRLHKYEFEFVMPEMDDAGKTVISNTTYSGQTGNAEEATVLKGSESGLADNSNLEPDFDITGGAEPDFVLDMADADAVDDSEEETIIPGANKVDELANETDPGAEVDAEDETLIPGDFGLQEDQSDDAANAQAAAESPDEETLMRSDFTPEEDEDVTIRKEADEALEDFLDIGADNKEGKTD